MLVEHYGLADVLDAIAAKVNSDPKLERLEKILDETVDMAFEVEEGK